MGPVTSIHHHQQLVLPPGVSRHTGAVEIVACKLYWGVSHLTGAVELVARKLYRGVSHHTGIAGGLPSQGGLSASGPGR